MDSTPAFQVSILRQMFSLFGFGFTRNCTQDVRAITLDSDPRIKRLPSELLLLIIDHLPVASAASLSLTCFFLHLRLRKRCLDTSLKNAENSIIREFLYYLERDLPTHVVCPSCVGLHPIAKAKKYHHQSHTDSGSRRPWLECWHRDFNSGIRRGTYDEFSSIIFHMAMEAHRQHRDHETAQCLKLLSCGPKRYTDLGFIEQRTVEARVQHGSLLLREQTVFIVPSSEEIPLPWYGGIDICAHIMFATMRSLYVYGIQIPTASQIEIFENRQGVISCDHCYTEFRVDFKGYGKAGNAMFVTKWMDLGEGRDFEDHKLRSRLSIMEVYPRTEVTFPRGSICASFEQKFEAAFQFDSLLSDQDAKSLCKANFRPWPEGTKVSFVDSKPYYEVRNGRIVPLPTTLRLTWDILF